MASEVIQEDTMNDNEFTWNHTIPIGSVLSTDGWIPPEKQPLAVRAGIITGEQIAQDVVKTTMAVTSPNTNRMT